MFAGTSYAHDALGTRASFDKTTAEMLKRFYDAWYVPNNAILVMVGDLDPPATLQRIRDLFGSIPAKHLPVRPRVQLRAVKSAALRLETDQPTGTQLLAMRAPPLSSPDYPAFEVLADVLSSRRFDLYALVPQGNAIEAAFSLDPLPQESLAYSEVSFPVGVDVAALQGKVLGILAKVAKEGVPAQLVQGAKLQERRAAQFQKNSIAGLASVWSDAVALYGLNSPDDELARIERVTVADVARVARRYLNPKAVVSAVLMPQGAGRAVAARGGFGGQENIALGEATPTQLPNWAQSALARLTVPPSTTAPIVSTLANGLTLIVQPEDISDTISVSGHIRNRPEIEAPHSRKAWLRCCSSYSHTAANGSIACNSRAHWIRSVPKSTLAPSSESRFSQEISNEVWRCSRTMNCIRHCQRRQ